MLYKEDIYSNRSNTEFVSFQKFEHSSFLFLFDFRLRFVHTRIFFLPEIQILWESEYKKRLSHSKTKLISFEGYQQHLYELQVLPQIQLLAKKIYKSENQTLCEDGIEHKKSLGLFLFNLITSLWIGSFLLFHQKQLVK